MKYGSYMEYVWDETYGAYIPDKDGMLRYNSTGDRVENLVGGSYDPAAHTLTIAFSADSGYRAPDEGTKVSVSYTMYEYGMFMFQSCEKVYMESNDVWSARERMLWRYDRYKQSIRGVTRRRDEYLFLLQYGKFIRRKYIGLRSFFRYDKLSHHGRVCD